MERLMHISQYYSLFFSYPLLPLKGLICAKVTFMENYSLAVERTCW